MRPDDQRPADTTMMRIVHDALRRDLVRAEHHLAAPERRAAIADHLAWMMDFVRAHHASEDLGLYPLVRSRAAGDPTALAVLDRMAADHAAIESHVDAVTEAAAALVADQSDGNAASTADAVRSLADVLFPHLRAEEDEAMPLASSLITSAEWRAVEQEHNLDPKSTTELGMEGHWLIDGADPSDRAVVLGLVPPLPRFLLVHGLGRRYRRRATDCWGPSSATERRVQLANEVEVTVTADVADVWAVVTDVTRIGEWSHECMGAAWLDGARSAVTGARFRGRNRSGLVRWGRVCEVLSAEPHELVWRTVPTRLYPDSCEWRLVVTAGPDGTRIMQSFRAVRAPRILVILFAYLVPAHRDRTTGLTRDLERLGRVAAGRRTRSAT